MAVETINPIIDPNTGLMADRSENGIKIVKTYDCMKWIDSIKPKRSWKNTLFQFTYCTDTNPQDETGVYFTSPIVYAPSKNEVETTYRTSTAPFLTAVEYFAEAEEKLYNGLVKNGGMSQSQALDFIDNNYTDAIGAVKLDSEDAAVLKLFKDLTSEARQQLAETGKIEWSKETRDLLLKNNVSSNISSLGNAVEFVKSWIHALNISNVIDTSIHSRGAMDSFSKDEKLIEKDITPESIRDGIIDVIKGESNSLPGSSLRAFRNYTLVNILASGNFSVIEFEVADWDKFLKVLNWYQQEDTYE